MKVKFLALAVAATVFAATSANAAVPGSWTIGAAGGWAHASTDNFDQSYTGFNRGNTFQTKEEFEESGFGLKVYGEYNFNSWFGLGVGFDGIWGQEYKATGSVNGIKVANEKADVSTGILELYGKLAYPITDTGSDVFFKFGPTVSVVSAEYRHDGYKETGDKTTVGGVVGVGANWAINQNFGVRVGYDYFFNTYKEDDYKIHQGMLYLGLQYTFGCEPKAAPVAPAAKQVVRVSQKHTLDADILFPFDGAKLSAKGQEAVSTIVEKSASLQNTEYEVYGYTDRIGSDAYNDKLSQKRADAVTTELQNKGIAANVSEGKGKSSPVTGNKCDNVKGKKALIDCLAPDRRVDVIVTGETEQ